MMNNNNNDNNNNIDLHAELLKMIASGAPKNSDEAFLGTLPQEYQEVYCTYLDLLAAQTPQKKIPEILAAKIETLTAFPHPAALTLARVLVERFQDPDFNSKLIDHRSNSQAAFITAQDYERYLKLTSVDPQASPALKRLLLSFIVFYRRNFHKSGWVRYDKKSVIYLADVAILSIATQEELTCYLHKEYGLDMRVVGSNNPTPCFRMEWLFNQSQPGSHLNPFLYLGPLSPSTIAAVAASEINPLDNPAHLIELHNDSTNDTNTTNNKEAQNS